MPRHCFHRGDRRDEPPETRQAENVRVLAGRPDQHGSDEQRLRLAAEFDHERAEMFLRHGSRAGRGPDRAPLAAPCLSQPRRKNDYREYADGDVEHLRLLIDLRRLEIPLGDAARIAGWCHSGHCADTNAHLPTLIGEQRAQISERIARLQGLDARLAGLEGHLVRQRPMLAMLGDSAPCCDAASAVVKSAEGGCACCAPAAG